MAFQMMFAVITPALITGAFAERKRFKAFVLFSLLWDHPRLLADRPLGLGRRRLAPPDGRSRLRRRRPSSTSARALPPLVAALVLGPRVKRESDRFEPHDVRLTVIGAGLLWFGWFRLQRRFARAGRDTVLPPTPS